MNPPLAGSCGPKGSQVHRILILDDHSFFAFCLRSLIEREADLRVCHMAADDAALQDCIAELRPDLLVIDLSVGRGGGHTVGRELRAVGVTVPILFISSMDAAGHPHLASIPDSSFACKGGNPNLLIARIKRLLASASDARWQPAASAVA